MAHGPAPVPEFPWIQSYPPGIPQKLAPSPFANLLAMGESSERDFAHRPAFSVCLPNGMSQTLSYQEVGQLSTRFAWNLIHRFGVRPGDHVGIQIPNSHAYPIAAWGIWKAGAVLVNVNPLYTTREMHHQFVDSEIKVLVISDLFAEKLAPILPQTAIKHVILASVAECFPLIKRTLVDVKLRLSGDLKSTHFAHHKFQECLQTPWGTDHRLAPLAHPPTLKSLAVLQYTGGTTGVSKGAMLTHGNLLANAVQVVTWLGSSPAARPEVMLTALPLYHAFSFTVNFLSMYIHGAHILLVPSPRPVANLKKPLARFPVTLMTGVNTLFLNLAEEPWFQASPPRTLRFSIAGGSALLPTTERNWRRVSGSPVFEGYGLTEASPVLTYNPIDEKMARTGSIGLPLPETELRIVAEDGTPAGTGEPGEIHARGPQVMLGYWKKPEETEKILRDGWLATGDIATMDEAGFFRIIDRKKDLILVSGFNVYPNEVEAVLCQHPAVLEAAVVGDLDDRVGEIVCAHVVLRSQASATEAELREFCKASLAHYKVPRKVLFAKDLPKSPIGKILRKDLRNGAA